LEFVVASGFRVDYPFAMKGLINQCCQSIAGPVLRFVGSRFGHFAAHFKSNGCNQICWRNYRVGAEARNNQRSFGLDDDCLYGYQLAAGSTHGISDAILGAILAGVCGSVLGNVVGDLAAAGGHLRCRAISGMRTGNGVRVFAGHAVVGSISDHTTPAAVARGWLGQLLSAARGDGCSQQRDAMCSRIWTSSGGVVRRARATSMAMAARWNPDVGIAFDRVYLAAPAN
jgi:hypothetical protein